MLDIVAQVIAYLLAVLFAVFFALSFLELNRMVLTVTGKSLFAETRKLKGA